METSWKSAIGGAAILGALVLYLTVGARTKLETGLEYVSRVSREAQTEYASIATDRVPLEHAAVRSLVDRATLRGSETVGAKRTSELLDELSEFLTQRFCDESPSRYRQWRAQKGYVPQPWRELIRDWDLGDQARILLGPSVSVTEQSRDQLFDEFWRSKQEWANGFNRYIAIASETKGLAIVFGRMTRGNPIRQMISGAMTDEAWHGAIAGTHCAWWKPPRTGKELAAKLGSVEYAECGVIMECIDGSRRPVITTWFWDPALARWMLEHLNINNEPSPNLAVLDY